MAEAQSGSGPVGFYLFSDKGVLRRLHELLGLRAGEGTLVLLMFLHSFCGGIPLTLTQAAGSALFLKNHGAESLPYAYIGAAVVIPALGALYVKLEHALSFTRLLTATILFMAAGDFVLRLVLALAPARFGSAAMPVWAEAEYTLTSLTYWGLAGRMFNVQQAKRLFGLIGSGTLVAAMASGFLLPFLLDLMGVNNVISLSSAGGIASLLVMRRIARLFPGRVEGHDRAHPEGGAVDPQAERETRGYVFLIYALMAMSFASYYLVDALFYDRAEARFTDQSQLAGFIGVFFGACGFFCLVFRLWLSGFLLGRYGLLIGVLMLPVLIFALATLGAGLGLVVGAGTALFLVVALMRAVDRVLRESIDLTAGLILYQPLPVSLRARAQGIAEAIVGPLAGGATGVLLLVLMTHLHWDASRVTFGAIVVGGAWAFIANRERLKYRGMLERALAARHLGEVDLSLEDASSRAVLERGLHSRHPGEVLYALSMMEEVAPQSLEPVLIGLLRHAAPEIRRDALARIGRLTLTTALPAVEGLFQVESVPAVRGAALRVMPGLGDSGLECALACLNDPAPLVRAGAMIGLLGSGDVHGIVEAGQRLGDLTRSATPSDRAFAAQVLGEAGLDSLFHPLLTLLRDPDLAVRRAALTACERIHHPRLGPLIVESLRTPALRSVAVAALVAGGERVLPVVEASAVFPDESIEVRIRLARTLGRIQGKRATAILRNMLDHADDELQPAVLAALVACEYTPVGADRAKARELIQQSVAYATRALTGLVQLKGSNNDLLVRALERELFFSRERLLLLLAGIFDSKSILGARANLQNASAERRAIALELIDTTVRGDLKSTALALLDELTPADCLRKLGGVVPTGPADPAAATRHILDMTAPAPARWTTTSALYRAGANGDVEALPLVRRFVDSKDPIQRETAAWAVRKLAAVEARAEEGDSMLLTVEKVMVLKSVPMFADTPDDVLAEVAPLLKEVRVAADEVVFRKGDLGDCLYILVEGQVRIHNGPVPLRTLGDREVFGEMAVLDPEPRSASATAVVPSLLFRLDQAEFYDFMADRVEMLRGILRVLCQRVRTRDAVDPGAEAMAKAG